jgi:hypothetical protein
VRWGRKVTGQAERLTAGSPNEGYCDVAQGHGHDFSLRSEDVRLHTAGDTLYLLARSDRVSRSLCGSLGGDVTRAEAGWAAEGRTMQLGWVTSCHAVRHLIVCTDDDAACIAHERRHRSEGAFHQ